MDQNVLSRFTSLTNRNHKLRTHTPQLPSLHSVCQGCQNGAFGKRSFCWVTPAIFVIFVDFRGSRSKISCFCWQNAISEFSPIFVKTTCFRQGTKRPFSKTTVSTTLSLVILTGFRCAIFVHYTRRLHVGVGQPGVLYTPHVFSTTCDAMCSIRFLPALHPLHNDNLVP